MAITLSGTRITLDYEAGDTKGDSWSNPWIMDDLMAVASGIIKQGSYYYVPYSIYIINLSTYFLIEDQIVEFDTDVDDLYYLNAYNTNLRIYGANETCLIKTNYTSSKRVYLYGASIDAVHLKNVVFTGFSYFLNVKNIKAENLIVHDIDFVYEAYGNGSNIDNSGYKKIGGSYGIIIDAPETGDLGTFNDIVITDIAISKIFYFRGNYTIRNLKAYGSIPTYEYYLYPNNKIGAILKIIDCQIGYSTYEKNAGYGVGDTKIEMYSTFNFLVNIQGGGTATVNVYDQYNNLQDTFSITSDILTQREIMFYSHWFNAGTLEEEINQYEPFRIEVVKADHETLVVTNIIVIKGDQYEVPGKLLYLPLEVFSLTFTNCSNEVSKNGTITVQAQGGSGNYNYSNDGGIIWQASGSFTGLAEGDYNVKIKDTTTLDEIEAGVITISSEKMYISGIDGTIEEEVIDGTIEEEVINGELVEEIINGTIE